MQPSLRRSRPLSPPPDEQVTDNQAAGEQTANEQVTSDDTTENAGTASEKKTEETKTDIQDATDSQEAATPAEPAKAPARAPQAGAALSEVWLSTSGDDAKSGADSANAVKTLDKALELVQDGGTIHTTGTYTVGNLTIGKSVTFTGSGNFLTVSGGTLSAPGKTIAFKGYSGVALTVQAGATLGDGNYHCFNDVGGCVFDLTSEQFGNRALDYDNCPEQRREDHFAKAEKRQRYELLRGRLMEALAGRRE